LEPESDQNQEYQDERATILGWRARTLFKKGILFAFYMAAACQSSFGAVRKRKHLMSWHENERKISSTLFDKRAASMEDESSKGDRRARVTRISRLLVKLMRK
jgi:membrane peptidoglycan carboxypeptidase